MAEESASPSHRSQFGERDLEQRKALVGFKDEDLEDARQCGDAILPHVDELIEGFFSFLKDFDGSKGLFADTESLTAAKQLQAQHLRALVTGNYSPQSLEEQINLATFFGKAGLAPRLFIGGFHHLMEAINILIYEHIKEPDRAFAGIISFKKLSFFDITIVVDVLINMREQTIARQQEAILELSTPILQLRDRLLILPIIGFLDDTRAKQLTNTLLLAIRANRAKVVVIDITGVAVVDSKVADRLIQTIAAARLMGARVVVTGLSGDVAQALVTLGVDLSTLNTAGDLREGVEEAERFLIQLPNSTIAPISH
jgi:rsbT co-antagonist protein RsbR